MKRTLVPRSSFVAVFTAALLLVFASLPCRAQFSPLSGPGSALSIPQDRLIQADTLNHSLQDKTAARPLMLQVGSHVLFTQAHIPGSEYAGPGSQPEGLQLLARRVSSLPKSKAIVLYCGCCPWNRCPNLAPAYQQLQKMGFINVKVLYLPNNFGADWADKGFAVERGQ